MQLQEATRVQKKHMEASGTRVDVTMDFEITKRHTNSRTRLFNRPTYTLPEHDNSCTLMKWGTRDGLYHLGIFTNWHDLFTQHFHLTGSVSGLMQHWCVAIVLLPSVKRSQCGADRPPYNQSCNVKWGMWLDHLSCKCIYQEDDIIL